MSKRKLPHAPNPDPYKLTRALTNKTNGIPKSICSLGSHFVTIRQTIGVNSFSTAFRAIHPFELRECVAEMLQEIKDMQMEFDNFTNNV